MSTYRVEWDCCGSVTETEAWGPERCPFCDTTEIDAAVMEERERCAALCLRPHGWLSDAQQALVDEIRAAIRQPAAPMEAT